ncbi:rhodanese-like domain-containing protein [Desulfitobacterium hafniense]|uniref:rhodanese-like domain-containing protein n=1 Tax=Desulfitobacterium hafniense TaxID=49338 RepID=UPI0003735351|nr:rhodanese-like domain-containing protein [Desulfitobacterium hafniense]
MDNKREKRLLEDHCSPAEAMELFKNGGIFALLDVREQEEFSRSHMLLASSAPYSRLEFIVPLLIPCKTVPVVVMDSGENDDSRAWKAYRLLGRLGYTQVHILAGGLVGWQSAGYVVVKGVSSLAKGYAEILERKKEVPGYTPEEIKEQLAQGRDVAFLDIRVPEEFNSMSLPEGINAPGCESAYRFHDISSNPDTLVVVNCGARTRSILFAQMLIDFGVPNPIATLKGGTMTWRGSGFELEYGVAKKIAPPSAEALSLAKERANSMAARFGIEFVDAQTVRKWQDEAQNTPLYIFDVRQPEEYEAGHLEGSRCAPGGQLTQRSDEYAAVRKARIVLVDDTEVRAIITAYWLKQIAMPNVYVLKGGLGGSGLGREGLVSGPEPKPSPTPAHKNPIRPKKLSEILSSKTPPLVINVGYSDKHRQGHIPGSVWVPRGWLERAREAYPEPGVIVITSDCEAHAQLAAADAKELWNNAEVFFLEGGTTEWKNSHLPLEYDMPIALTAEDDIWYLMYIEPDAPLNTMEDFLDWKHELAEQITRDGSYRFCLPGATE